MFFREVKKMKKKKGSSILMILAISAVIVILLGTAVGAMAFTQRGNNIEKIDNDLLYAAEGGIELRISLIRKDDKYGKTILDSIDQTQIDNMEIKLKTNTVHSVETKTEELIGGKHIKITSIAYGYDDDRVSSDLNNKKTIEKIIVKESSQSSETPSSRKIFENSIVAEKKVNAESVGSVNMSTTKITGGDSIELPTAAPGVALPIPGNIKSDKIETSIFKPIGTDSATAIPNIREQGTIVVTSIYGAGGLSTIATNLQSDGTTVATDGIGKFTKSNLYGVSYNIILVNAKKLIVRPSSTIHIVNTIIICSGDIEIEVIPAGVTITRSTFFGTNVSAIKPGSLSIFEAPAIGATAYDLSSTDLDAIDLVMSEYISNWGVSGLPPGGNSGVSGTWREDESKTIYE